MNELPPPRPNAPAYSGYGFEPPRATVHWCAPDLGHRLHMLVGMGREPGWFVLTQSGCIGDVHGPFDTEAKAQAVADEWLAAAGASRS
jgi:hypothetical protein